MSYAVKISNFLSSIADMFSADYNGSEINEIRDDILDISFIPTTSDDKKNLKKDFNTMLKDTKKAHGSLNIVS